MDIFQVNSQAVVQAMEIASEVELSVVQWVEKNPDVNLKNARVLIVAEEQCEEEYTKSMAISLWPLS